MSTMATLSELELNGITLEAHEAVAVVLALMDRQPEAEDGIEQRTGPPALPSPSTIRLTRDGAASCTGIATLSSAEIATLLQQMLEHTTHVPPALLYLIARASGAVEAVPFESPDELFTGLTRFERGARRDVISGIVARFEAVGDPTSDVVRGLERRRLPKQVTDLRHELRAADLRAYEQQAVHAAPAATTPKTRTLLAAAVIGVSLVAGLALLARGDSIGTATTPAESTPKAAADGAGREDAATAVATSGPSAVSAAPSSSDTRHRHDVSTRRAPATSKPAIRRASASARPAQSSRLRSALRFEWVRHLFRSRNTG